MTSNPAAAHMSGRNINAVHPAANLHRMHGDSLVLVPSLTLISIAQVTELALCPILASNHLPEERTWLACALIVQNRTFAGRLWRNKLCQHEWAWGAGLETCRINDVLCHGIQVGTCWAWRAHVLCVHNSA